MLITAVSWTQVIIYSAGGCMSTTLRRMCPPACAMRAVRTSSVNFFIFFYPCGNQRRPGRALIWVRVLTALKGRRDARPRVIHLSRAHTHTVSLSSVALATDGLEKCFCNLAWQNLREFSFFFFFLNGEQQNKPSVLSRSGPIQFV